MATVKVCDWCGQRNPIRFELKEQGQMSHETKDLCSKECVYAMASVMEPDIIKVESAARNFFGRFPGRKR